jgi:hypothetical protein
MAEVVHWRDGDAVALRPCPPGGTADGHFVDGEVIYTDNGYHHYGAEAEVPTSYPFLGLTDGVPTVVRAVLMSWTQPPGGDPRPPKSSSPSALRPIARTCAP